MTSLLEQVKSALRITTSDTGIVSEVTLLIEAAKMDLIMSGVREEVFIVPDEELPDAVKFAIITYCKANFGLDNPERESFMEVYHLLEKGLVLSKEYGESHEG